MKNLSGFNHLDTWRNSFTQRLLPTFPLFCSRLSVKSHSNRWKKVGINKWWKAALFMKPRILIPIAQVWAGNWGVIRLSITCKSSACCLGSLQDFVRWKAQKAGHSTHHTRKKTHVQCVLYFVSGMTIAYWSFPQFPSELSHDSIIWRQHQCG